MTSCGISPTFGASPMGLSIVKGSTSRSATNAHTRQRSLLGAFLNTHLNSTAASTIQPAAMLILNILRKTDVISVTFVFVYHALELRYILLTEPLLSRKRRNKSGKRTVEVLFHKLLGTA